jgi:hypothetical protein
MTHLNRSDLLTVILVFVKEHLDLLLDFLVRRIGRDANGLEV